MILRFTGQRLQELHQVALLFHRQAQRIELTVAVDICLATAVIELDDVRKRSGTAVVK